jgi:hypothetical protein
VNVGADQARTDTGTFIAASNTSTHAHEADDEEASSQPRDPHVGMRDDTLEMAK